MLHYSFFFVCFPQTRIADWREGALQGNYLKRKLQDAAEQLKQYEINAAPKGWSCHWDRYALFSPFHLSPLTSQTWFVTITNCRRAVIYRDWEQLHLAVLSGQKASGTYRVWASHKNWRNIKSVLSVLKWIWFRDWTELVFTLEYKCAKEGGLGGSRMRELCAHYRISGTPLPSNVCVLMESSLTWGSQRTTRLLSPASRSDQTISSYIWLSWLFLFIWNLCSFVFQLPDPLPLSSNSLCLTPSVS